jgi:hypothetical protein
MASEQSHNVLTELGLHGLAHTKTVTSSVTTAWGVNWDHELVARDLMQNFFDDNRHQVSKVKIEANRDDIRVSSPKSFNLERLYFLGSEKGANDVGKYGEGFKAAATCVLRERGTVVAAASDKQVVRIRIDDEPVQGTKLYPLVYDFFTASTPYPGNVLIIHGASPKLSRAMEQGMNHFFHPGNPLIGPEADRLGQDFIVYRSTTADGHIFYRNLKRGEIPNLPLVLVLNKEYAAIEKKIASDRDRKAFGEDVRKIFYSVWAKSFFNWQSRQQTVVEAARACWENGEGHPLLAEVARACHGFGWRPEHAKSVFADQYFARSLAKDATLQVRYESVESAWRRQGRRELPNYFSQFGVSSAERHLKEIEERARHEARTEAQRATTSGESRAIALLTKVLRGLAPEIMAVFDRGKTSYSVAKTEAVLGELKQLRGYRAREVFLAESVFEAGFAKALSIFLHEHSHIFGHDGSRGFSDALTELLEVVIQHRETLGKCEEQWNQVRLEIVAERDPQHAREPFTGEELGALGETELRTLLRRLPLPVLEHLLAKQPPQACTSS